MKFAFGDFYLRRATDADAEALRAICSDPEVMAYYGHPGFDPSSADGALHEIAWFNEQFEKRAGRWVISVRGEDRYVGDIGFFNHVEEHNRVEVGYKLEKRYWGSGVVSEFLAQLLRYGFNDLGYNRVEAAVDPRNLGSRRVLHKNGFRHEGTFREYERENGVYIDVEMWALLKKDHYLGL